MNPACKRRSTPTAAVCFSAALFVSFASVLARPQTQKNIQTLARIPIHNRTVEWALIEIVILLTGIGDSLKRWPTRRSAEAFVSPRELANRHRIPAHPVNRLAGWRMLSDQKNVSLSKYFE